MFTETVQLESVDGKVEFVVHRSGMVAARLNAKRSLMFSLYGKARLLDETSEVHMDVLAKAEMLAFEHDMEKMLYAIASWDLPSEAFVMELEEYPVNRGSLELLREAVFGEINQKISGFWDKKPLTDDETKNSTTPSTDSLTSVPSEQN